MFSIFIKELNGFFSSLIAYIVIAVFLVMIGLYMWVFPETNLFDYNFATMEQLFAISPVIFMFLIPAITMRSFAEEKQNGTMEFLFTKPVTDTAIVMGKFLAAFALVVFALLPTLLYYYTVYELGAPKGNLDTGAIIGSYIGLVFLGAAFTAIGLFASALTNNQIVAFLLAAFLCFFTHWAFSYLAGLPLFIGNMDIYISQLGMSYHYTYISKGALDSRNIIYFISVIAVFLLASLTVLNSKKA
jgi:ABC-2 type transport system permease protein